MRDDFYRLKRENHLGPGSFDIIRDFDKSFSKYFTYNKASSSINSKEKPDNLENFSKQQSSLLNESKRDLPKITTPGPGFYDPDKIKAHIYVK